METGAVAWEAGPFPPAAGDVISAEEGTIVPAPGEDGVLLCAVVGGTITEECPDGADGSAPGTAVVASGTRFPGPPGPLDVSSAVVEAGPPGPYWYSSVVVWGPYSVDSIGLSVTDPEAEGSSPPTDPDSLSEPDSDSPSEVSVSDLDSSPELSDAAAVVVSDAAVVVAFGTYPLSVAT